MEGKGRRLGAQLSSAFGEKRLDSQNTSKRELTGFADGFEVRTERQKSRRAPRVSA